MTEGASAIVEQELPSPRWAVYVGLACLSLGLAALCPCLPLYVNLLGRQAAGKVFVSAVVIWIAGGFASAHFIRKLGERRPDLNSGAVMLFRELPLTSPR